MNNKYQRGKIYKLVSSQTDKIYIGSTIKKLKQRKAHHKFCPVSSRKITCFDDFDIVLIKNYPCNSRKELEREEGCLIKQNLDICVNQQIAGRTDKEWRDENKDILKQKHKIYILNNIEKIKITKNNYYLKNKEIIKEKHKIYKNKNKDKINNKKKEICNCECGFTYTRSNKSTHLKSKKHLSNLFI